MGVIKQQDLAEGEHSLVVWKTTAKHEISGVLNGQNTYFSKNSTVDEHVDGVDALPRRTWAMAVRYSLHLMEQRAPGEGVEVRVAPWGAIKILDGPASDPHNLTPPDVIELEPDVWLRLVCGITTWDKEKKAGHISAVGERDDLSDLLPLI
ncbi:sterol carrier family protein [Bifidobacterium catulorum]|uniref:Bacterial SCP orthologue domain-containing protein n=1 Tax=Bifidobacterium catulorum TaxID=1630173 RepID=A0A2U2MRX7_9BIFI|nr:sterol carrier family protein [Bifidobacterium catulorum]PWG59593.1 hypothetical protein DF200_06865 [Bifidobacterium catulorum]